MLKLLRACLVLFAMLTLLTGVIYPFAITGLGRLFFSKKANGAGSFLIGQPFQNQRYFFSRPSKSNDFAYNAASSSGGNQGPQNEDWKKEVKQRIQVLKEADPGNTNLIPVDLVTASGSGLDPHISKAAAFYQIPRVAKERNVSEAEVAKLVQEYTEERQFFILGEPRVHVLLLNVALDQLDMQRNVTFKQN